MPVAGYASTVKFAEQGLGASFTDEATTLTSGIYQVNDTAKRIWDPSVAVVVKDGGSAVAAANILALDYLFGRVTFIGTYSVGGAVTVSGNYLTPVTIANSKEFDISCTAVELDVTVFAASGWKLRKTGQLDASGSLSGLDPAPVLLSGHALIAALTGALPVLLEVRPGGAGQYFRGWALLESVEQKGTVEGLLESSYKWVSAPVKNGAAFSIGT